MTIFELWKMHEMPKAPFNIYKELETGEIANIKITAIIIKSRTEPQEPCDVTFYGESSLDSYSGDCNIDGMNVSHNAIYRKGHDFGYKKEIKKN